MSDLIDRQKAIDAIRGWVNKAFEDWGNAETEIRCFNAIYPLIMALPSAQPDFDEWCTDCKEYDKERNSCPRWNRVIKETLKDLREERKTQLSEESTTSDCISRQVAIDEIRKCRFVVDAIERIRRLPSAQPECAKYEYHYDHTDCIWYRPEARNRCPTTCAQYRDGWNDAMNYIFRDGKGYRPFRRDRHYEE